ncbi:MAG: hypothetical protein ACXQS8_00880 [Candidatus Helarchaeales archaeon]
MVSFRALKLLEKRHARRILKHLAERRRLGDINTFSSIKKALDLNDFLLDKALKELCKEGLVRRNLLDMGEKKSRPTYSITVSGLELLTFNPETDDLVKRTESGISFQVGKITEFTINEDMGPDTISVITQNKELNEKIEQYNAQIKKLKAALRKKLKDNEKLMSLILAHIDAYLKL